MGKKRATSERPNSWYGFFAPGTDVLKNALDIEDPKELEDAERTLSQARQAVGADTIPRTFDFEHFKTIHLNLFQDIYPDWAGEVRPVGISKGVNFTEPAFIESYAKDTFSKLAEKNFLQHLTREEFAAEAAELLGHLNAIHPFREGNGRTQREFIRQLADEAGYDFDLSGVTADQNNEASYLSLAYGDDSGLHKIMDGAIKERVAKAA